MDKVQIAHPPWLTDPNPSHLKGGTHAENMQDMMRKGRGKNQFARR